MLANMGQHVPEVESTEYIKLYLQIFELELKEYMKRKEAHATARSTATPAESVDYDTIRRQRVPVIAEAMDALNAPQQVEESQQNFKRRQNAVRQQATISGVLLRAVSDIETTMSKVVDEEVEILQPPQIPGSTLQSRRKHWNAVFQQVQKTRKSLRRGFQWWLAGMNALIINACATRTCVFKEGR
ncbi:hypothetical protein C0995_012132 [Termitomyces sp. Mi166|nr:hypothetical protein C0995_012132 [Termitomyces sp. Mi166\